MDPTCKNPQKHFFILESELSIDKPYIIITLTGMIKYQRIHNSGLTFTHYIQPVSYMRKYIFFLGGEGEAKFFLLMFVIVFDSIN